MTDEEIAAKEAAEAQAKADAEAKAAEEAKKARESLKNKSDDDDDDDDAGKAKSKVSDETAKLLKEVMKLKEKAKAEEDARKKLEDQYKGIDLDAARAALKAAEEAEHKELEKKGEYDRLLAKQREKSEALLEAANARIKEMESKLSEAAKAVDELSLGNAFANSKFIQEKLALTPNKTKALYSSHFEIEDGKLIAYDKPKGSPNRTALIDARGDNLTFEEAISEIINSDPDKEYLLKADVRKGAGSKASDAITDALKEKKYQDSIDKIAAGLNNAKNFAPKSLKDA